MSRPVRVVRIVEGTSVDGPGLRTSIYVAGCRHQCPGCHNQSTWDFSAGEDMTVEDIMKIVRYNGFNVTLTGGDPMYSAAELLPLVRLIKEEGYRLWIYTGFVYEDLLANGSAAQRELLDFADVLVDGPFIESRRDINLIFRGSDNQRLVDVPSSKKNGVTKFYELDV